MLLGTLSVIFVIVSIILVLLILVQNDKGGGISSSFGGGMAGANSVMGAQNTENILTKGTIIFAVVYFALAIFISLVIPKLETANVSATQVEAERMIETEQ